MPYGETWLPVWTALSDESLAQRVRYYRTLSSPTSAFCRLRFALLFAEANKRGKLKTMDNAKQRVATQTAGTLVLCCLLAFHALPRLE